MNIIEGFTNFPNIAKYILVTSIILLILTCFNAYKTDVIYQAFARAEVIAGISSTILMLVGFLWTEVNPKSPNTKKVHGQEGFEIIEDLPITLSEELAWGSKLILTATPASSVLVYWKDRPLLRRGILGDKKFVPGEICNRASNTGKFISLVKTSLYPGKDEVYNFVDNIPAVIISPIGSNGWLLVGGWNERCFTTSDEKWISGWSEKLNNSIQRSCFK